jgi:glycosyltransferase involved in cell wall biosynthesis
VYISACEIGGVHPALIEAMAARNAVLYLDTPANRETTGGCALAFSADAADLAQKLALLVTDSQIRADLATRAQENALRRFGWESVTRQYEQLFAELLGRDRK